MKSQKNNNKIYFNGMTKRVYNNIFSLWTSWNIWSVGGSFQFLVEISQILKVLAHEISDEFPKKIKFSILIESWREVIVIFCQHELHEKKIERWWMFSIFCRNSRILKVLAHEISDEIPKKLKFSILMVRWRDLIIIFSQ